MRQAGDPRLLRPLALAAALAVSGCIQGGMKSISASEAQGTPDHSEIALGVAVTRKHFDYRSRHFIVRDLELTFVRFDPATGLVPDDAPTVAITRYGCALFRISAGNCDVTALEKVSRPIPPGDYALLSFKIAASGRSTFQTVYLQAQTGLDLAYLRPAIKRVAPGLSVYKTGVPRFHVGPNERVYFGDFTFNDVGFPSTLYAHRVDQAYIAAMRDRPSQPALAPVVYRAPEAFDPKVGFGPGTAVPEINEETGAPPPPSGTPAAPRTAQSGSPSAPAERGLCHLPDGTSRHLAQQDCNAHGGLIGG
ncbi:hypothetical protein [Azospirillum sp. TSO22-1]|uniref:hypothetical protein n=1 Tax=Azospirillum sp. TSO22-1 TaxID=716789 RepID=UPI000D61057D|nr:hypothetical protein [Azospirillum sp. TSO22-1]PWC52314.1 hypothetical protein TSO221_14715 [Azospirillum sp. TSO22-1]